MNEQEPTGKKSMLPELAGIVPDCLDLIVIHHRSPIRYNLSFGPSNTGVRWCLHVKVPRGTSEEGIQKILIRHRRWIQNRTNHLMEGLERSNAIHLNARANGEEKTRFRIPINGVFHPIYLINTPSDLGEPSSGWPKSETFISDHAIHIRVSPGTPERSWQEKILSHMMANMLEKVRRILRDRCPRMGLSPTRVVIRNTHRQWGSMNRNGVMSLSFRLAFMADEDIDLVIVHELCHIPHKNHGPSFNALLSLTIPDHRLRMKRLSSFPGIEEWVFRSPLPSPSALGGQELPLREALHQNPSDQKKLEE